MSKKLLKWNEDRTLFPEKNSEGKIDVDYDSHKFMKIWHGPQHPGITGNMSLELTLLGDEVMDCETHVGYLHRGFEKLMERRKYIQCFPIVCRVAVPEPDFNEYCFASAMEELAGIEVPEAAEWLRTLVLEMSRLQSFLAWMGGQAGSLGQGIIGQWTIYLRDLILDRFEELTGGRIYHMYMLPGGVRGLLPDGFRQRMTENLDEIDRFMKDVKKVMFDNAVFKKRTVGMGVIDPAWIHPFGITGPNARAAGVAKDVRKDNPYLKYPELDFEPVVGKDSDIYTRADVRRRDLLMTVDLIRQIMAKIPDKGDIRAKTPNVLHWKVPAGETYSRAECTRGEYGYYMVSDGTEYPRRINVRGPSYTHAVALLEKMIVNANIADVAGLMVSLHTYPPEIER
ncbi:NADH-quinone oxidoreductase subunit D [Prolixibacter denitrificans]|uniref:NADH dehydrogenase subunit D n=1 Tax=Prolixibacter denitrificans TaxID=1541063 RepID=A0A2P8CEA5_9BACT|nr:NADH-quinone oxidoreductase subunit D [Prolixibacter denitrificans]PSK83307.1 NADH-quinone oxidoreductase subunit D [Prolixibacter denitrificans]GET21810.1 NADH dehydrogenase subunit D [Prolixibacter denitrificans]